MKFRYEGVDAESARHSSFLGPPPMLFTEGELVGAYYNPDLGEPWLILWNEKEKQIQTCPAYGAEKI